MNFDNDIFNLIKEEEKRQNSCLELIASENYVSKNVLKAVGSILTNKYAEGYPSRRYYGGCEFVDKIENIAIERAKKLFNVKYVNVQPHSGSQANCAVLSAILNPGDKILSLKIDFGGHLTHGTNVNFSGKLYKSYHYGVDKKTEIIDMNEVANIANKVKPKLIICGASAYSRDFDYKKFREIADSCGALLMADIAHTAGIIACGRLNDPFDFCHIVTTTTHKTLRGPRGGMILMRKDFKNPFNKKKKNNELKMMSELIDSSVFPGNQGGPLMHVIAGKAVCFAEDLTNEFKIYIDQVLKNAQVLSNLFKKNGYHVVTDGTDNHLLLIDLRNKNISGKECEYILQQAGITVNKNMVPLDDKPANITSGIRIGTPAITTKGFKTQDCEKVFEYINEAITNKDDSQKLTIIKKKIKNLCKNFDKY